MTLSPVSKTNPLGSVDVDQVAVLLVAEGLDRSGVEGSFASAEGQCHRRLGDQCLARTGRGGDDHGHPTGGSGNCLPLKLIGLEGEAGVEVLDACERSLAQEELDRPDGELVEEVERKRSSPAA